MRSEKHYMFKAVVILMLASFMFVTVEKLEDISTSSSNYSIDTVVYPAIVISLVYIVLGIRKFVNIPEKPLD